MERPPAPRPALILASVIAVGAVGLLAYWTIAFSLGCAEHDAIVSGRNCPDWFQGRTLGKWIVMLCAYLGPFVILAAGAGTVASRRTRYLAIATTIVAIPMLTLFLSSRI